MRRSWAFSLIPAAALAFAMGVAARADDVFSEAGHAVVRDFARNNHWPEPFIYPDRDAVVRPFGVMIAKGWQVQNTLSEYHFQQDNSRLAEAGMYKVQQILTDPVAQRHMIFVPMGATPQQTIARIAAVRASAAEMLPPGTDVAVYPSGIQSRPWLGTDVLNVRTGFDKSRPPVKLPDAAKPDQK